VSASEAWILVIGAGIVTQALRYLPVLLLRWRNGNMPVVLARVLESAGLATIGGLIALAVFRPAPAESVLPPVADVGLKLFALALAFILYVSFRRSIPALLIAYSTYVLLTLAFLPAS
jgi:branched-subunit amino acid transport protein